MNKKQIIYTAKKTLATEIKGIKSLSKTFNNNLYSKFAFIISLPVIRSFWNKVNPGKYNGAMFLGLNGIVVKSHGRSDADGFSNAISVAYDLCINNFNEKIICDIKKNF